MFVIQQELVVTSRPAGAQKIDTRPEASASPENLLKMQILYSYLRNTESELGRREEETQQSYVGPGFRWF